jgi:hypothetical protein
MRVLRRVVVATLSTALVLLGTSFVLAPAAHADCLMIGHADLGAAPALLHNPASQGDCNGYFRMFGYLQDKSADNRTAKLYVEGIRSDGAIIWTRNASASGYGKSTHFEWTNARVHHVHVCVWAENAWGHSTQYCTNYTGARQ